MAVKAQTERIESTSRLEEVCMWRWGSCTTQWDVGGGWWWWAFASEPIFCAYSCSCCLLQIRHQVVEQHADATSRLTSSEIQRAVQEERATFLMKEGELKREYVLALCLRAFFFF
jgi:hypothetical protein